MTYLEFAISVSITLGSVGEEGGLLSILWEWEDRYSSIRKHNKNPTKS